MKIQTLSIVCGTTACNAHCPFCVSRMTGAMDASLLKPTTPNWRNFDIAVRLALQSGVTTAMLTGKGEPTLWPELITAYLEKLDRRIPLIELQTNGIAFDDWEHMYDVARRWYSLGLSTIALSCVHWCDDENKEIYGPRWATKYKNTALGERIYRLHNLGFSVRLSCVLLKYFIDRPYTVEQMIEFAKNAKVEQLTLIPVNSPTQPEDEKVYEWAREHLLAHEEVQEIRDNLERRGTRLLTLPHGAVIYDFKGQNVCMSNCLQKPSGTDETRNLIFFPDGHLRYDWQYKGAILL